MRAVTPKIKLEPSALHLIAKGVVAHSNTIKTKDSAIFIILENASDYRLRAQVYAQNCEAMYIHLMSGKYLYS